MNNKIQKEIAKTIIGQIYDGNSELLDSLGEIKVSPMTPSKTNRGGAVIHLPQNKKILIELSWIDLYNVSLFTNVESNLEVTKDGNMVYNGIGKCVYNMDNCYFDMLANIIETALLDKDDYFKVVISKIN